MHGIYHVFKEPCTDVEGTAVDSHCTPPTGTQLLGMFNTHTGILRQIDQLQGLGDNDHT